MNIMAILRAVSAAGCTLTTREGRLFLSPSGRASAEIKGAISRRKAALVRFLNWAESDRSVCVRSSLRDAIIIIAGKDAKCSGRYPVIYRASELPFLAGMSRETLLTIHDVKCKVGGLVIRTEGED